MNNTTPPINNQSGEPAPENGMGDELKEMLRHYISRLRVRLLFQLRRVLPPADMEHRAEVQMLLREQSTPDFDYFVLVMLSCVIATLGLLIDSSATIIGAMLVAPLMSPILGLGLASIRGDAKLFRNAALALGQGAFIAILLSTLITLFNRVLPIVTLSELPQEVLSRTQPSPIDLGIALAGGLAATFALVQPDLSAALPGVAIATALMPPLCVVGVGIAQGDSQVAGGAFLLFLTNAITIAAASIALFYIVGFSPPRREGERGIPRSLQVSLVLTLILLAPLGWQSYSFVRQANFNRQVQAVVEEEASNIEAELSKMDWVENNDLLEIDITLLVTSSLRHADSVNLQDAIATRLQRTVQLHINQVLVSRLNPAVPPTVTPTLTLGPSPSPTNTQVPPTATATRITPSATPVPSATPAPFSAMLDDSAGSGANLRAFPGGPSTSYLPANSQITVFPGFEIVDGWVWVQVQDADGRTGWLPQFYMSTVTPTSTPIPAENSSSAR